MDWLDHFYSAPLSLSICLGTLLIIGLLSPYPHSRKIVLGLSALLYIRYMIWRGVYTLPTETTASMIVGWTVYVAEVYGLMQYGFFTFQAWSPTERTTPHPSTYPTVDIMVTVVDEPIELLKRTLIACLHQEYPKDRFTVCVLDDGNREDIRALASSLGCLYFTRPDRPRHAKAGNINYALQRTGNELVAIFDVDHVPVRTFLNETVGFFEVPRVAFVQTAHHFYNPDIFQRNLRLEQELQNEQALFFRVLQAGRDAHGSAFFAGSGGILRRRALDEIGGFQTQTVSEDLHTSLVLHAHGYESRYVNKVLSVGLMPDTFDGYLRQRTRWAIGSIQTLQHHNPLTTHGLTIRQRIDYLGSIFYFFFGIPRVICLIAPLTTLLFNIPALRAAVWELCLNFFSFYLASAVAMRPISRGTRNAFWSDIYEIAMCFALSRAVIMTLVTPRKERPFDVTPKGQLISQGPWKAFSRIWPHMAVFGLLMVGIVMGLQHWSQDLTIPGFGVSLFWACINLFLLAVAMLVANEQSQVRRLFRLPRTGKAELHAGGRSLQATTVDISEQGIALKVHLPIFSELESASIVMTDYSGRQLALSGRIVRQEPGVNGDVIVGIRFSDLDEREIQTLLITMFGESAQWNTSSSGLAPTTTRSLHALARAVMTPWGTLFAKRRQVPRIPLHMECTVETTQGSVKGMVVNASYNGLAALFASPPRKSLNGAILDVQGIKLRVVPVHISVQLSQTLIRFRIDRIDDGKQRWHDLHTSHWQRDNPLQPS